MKIQILSIVAGTAICNARCPFCISKMTPKQGVDIKEPEVNWRNFNIACGLAKTAGVNSAMITSKGEATLYPGQITKYLRHLQKHNFPLIELQTNAVLFNEQRDKYIPLLQSWYELGLTTIAISVVHYKAEKNKLVYTPHKENYINLDQTIDDLHKIGFSVRLSCMLAKEFIDTTKEVKELLKYAKDKKVEQVTIRSINKPDSSENKNIETWTSKHMLDEEELTAIEQFLKREGKQLMKLAYGGIVYDFNGQNVCLSNCLTIDRETDNIRQLIFFPDGHLRYDWQYEGAIIL